jgi:hypothetical protein
MTICPSETKAASWFETPRFAGLLTMRVCHLGVCDDLILRRLRSSRLEGRVPGTMDLE